MPAARQALPGLAVGSPQPRKRVLARAERCGVAEVRVRVPAARQVPHEAGLVLAREAALVGHLVADRERQVGFGHRRVDVGLTGEGEEDAGDAEVRHRHREPYGLRRRVAASEQPMDACGHRVAGLGPAQRVLEAAEAHHSVRVLGQRRPQLVGALDQLRAERLELGDGRGTDVEPERGRERQALIVQAPDQQEPEVQPRQAREARHGAGREQAQAPAPRAEHARQPDARAERSDDEQRQHQPLRQREAQPAEPGGQATRQVRVQAE